MVAAYWSIHKNLGFESHHVHFIYQYLKIFSKKRFKLVCI